MHHSFHMQSSSEKPNSTNMVKAFYKKEDNIISLITIIIQNWACSAQIVNCKSSISLHLKLGKSQNNNKTEQ
jgi:hypothetical protein